MSEPGPGDKTLEHLVWLYSLDPEYAKWAAVNYEEINPFDCTGMYDRLKKRILEDRRKQRGQV